MKKIIVLPTLLFYLFSFAQKFEGLAPTPPMGWNSWNTFQTNINEELVMQTADKFISSGMRDAGYVYLVLDDGWMAMKRDSLSGNLVADPAKFPRGMKAVADYVHSKGLKFGLYNCAGTKTCAGYPGTKGYEYQDARYYDSVGIDYLKFDWCYSDGLNAKEAYTTMSKALKTAGRPIVFSLCEWGTSKPWEWAEKVGHLWRTTGDITAQFDGTITMGTWTANGVMRIADMQEGISKYAGKDHWNDPDMLEVGNGLKEEENRAHFAIWCMMAAPLIAGNDITKMDASTLSILTDKDAIAIDQDALGIQGTRISKKDSLEIWSKPLSNGNWAFCFLNRNDNPMEARLDWGKYMKPDIGSSKSVGKYTIYNIWTKKNQGSTDQPLVATVQPHDVLFVRLIKN